MRADGVDDDSGLGPASSHLAEAIVVTILCCLPFGIPAIVYAAKVPGLNAAGKYREAHAASKQATTWAWISFGLGLLVSLAYAGSAIAAGVAAGSGSYP
jgi:interferon-induced transmembrane protein